jgi:hypothetical protein
MDSSGKVRGGSWPGHDLLDLMALGESGHHDMSDSALHKIMEFDQHVDVAKSFRHSGMQQREFVTLSIADDQGSPRGRDGLPKGIDCASSTNIGSHQHTIEPCKCAG